MCIPPSHSDCHCSSSLRWHFSRGIISPRGSLSSQVCPPLTPSALLACCSPSGQFGHVAPLMLSVSPRIQDKLLGTCKAFMTHCLSPYPASPPLSLLPAHKAVGSLLSFLLSVNTPFPLPGITLPASSAW